jgi:adenylate cyclase
MDRKLAVILVADIVGYSAQMERDEAGTYTRVTARRKDIFEPEIARHQGRIFKLVGDGLLAEFASVVQAVECAVSIQTALEERNAAVPVDQAVRARIGINLGEVIIDGDDRYGEGVNIAARLEQLAVPGGICVSDKVAREVEKKLAFGFQPMGPQKVKNITEPVMAYRVNRLGAPRRQEVGRRARKRWLWPGVLAVVAVIVAAVGLVWMNWPAAPQRDGPRGLAVLAFANLTGDPARDYLGAAVPDGIVTILSTSPVLRLAPRGASLQTSPEDGAKRNAWRLGVDYLLEGSIRRAGDGFEVTVELIDGQSGASIWTETYTEGESGIASLQGAVAKGVYVRLGSTVGAVAERALPAAWEQMTDDPAEYDVFLRGAGAILSFTDAGRRDAGRILTEGIAAFPKSALLRTLLAALHYNLVSDHVTDDPRREIDTAWRLLQEAGAKKNMSTLERWLFLYIRAEVTPMATGDLDAALRDAIEAQRMVPYEPQANIDLSQVAANAGRPDLAVAWADFAIAAMPPDAEWVRQMAAWAYLFGGRNDDALRLYEGFERPCEVCLATALVRAGRVEEARKVITDLRAVWPEAGIAIVRLDETNRFQVMVEPQLSAFEDDLRKAGLPEGTAPP